MKNKILLSGIMAGILSVVSGSMLNATLATNGGFEVQGGGGSEDSAYWNQGGNQGRQDWANEWGSYGHAFYGWVNGGNGYIEQYITCDTNATYYFRIRGLREPNFDNGTVEMKLRFYPSDSNWTLLRASTNNIGVSAAADTWIAYTTECATPPGAGIVQMRLEFSGSQDTGGRQSYKWDNVSLYNRRQHYKAREIVDEFSYDPDFDDGLTGKNRGNGFSGAWINAWGSGDISDYSFGEVAGYPKPYGNKLHLPNTGGGFYRNFPAVTRDSIYLAAYFNYGHEDVNNWAGISFMSNGVERAFFGGVSHDANTKMNLAIDSYGGTRVDSSYVFNAGIGQDYILIAKYTFKTRELKTIAYWKTDTIPYLEPDTWIASATLAQGQMPYVDGVRLACGGTDPGDVYFDEVRVAQTWYDLMNTIAPPNGTVFRFK